MIMIMIIITKIITVKYSKIIWWIFFLLQTNQAINNKYLFMQHKSNSYNICADNWHKKKR